MRIVLTDKDLDSRGFPPDVQVTKITYKTMDAYDHNNNVVAIAASRAIAIKANKMNFPGLKLFQLTSAGFDGVPFEEFRDKVAHFLYVFIHISEYSSYSVKYS